MAPPKPKILFLVTRYWPAKAGAALHTRELIQHLSQDFDISVVCHAMDEPISQELAFASLSSLSLTDGRSQIYRIVAWEWIRPLLKLLAKRYHYRWLRPLFNGILTRVLQKKLTHLIANHDVVHTVYTGMTPSVQTAQKIAQRHHKPFVLTTLSHIEDQQQQAGNSLKKVYRKAHKIIAMTPVEKHWLIRQGVDPEKIEVNPYGPLIQTEVNPKKFREKHRLADHPVILFLGRQVAYKGYAALIESTAEVWQQYPNTRFVFIGPMTAESRQYFSKVSDARILNLGSVSEREKCSALAACNAFCLPSTQESLGVVYLEAWFYQKPVIVADIPAMSNLVNNGEDGLIIKPTTSGISAAILELLNSPKKAEIMGCQGYQKVRANYDWHRISHQTKSMYGQLLDCPS